MGDLDADALTGGLIILGGALQQALGGPWLLTVGSVALGLRIAFAREDRRALLMTFILALVWIACHGVLGRDLSRIQATVEVTAFLAFLGAFWAVRLNTRTPADELGDGSPAETTPDMERRLARLRQEAEAMVQEREGWVGLFSIMKNLGEVIRVDDVVEVVKAATREHLRMPAFALLLMENGVIRVRAQQGGDDRVMEEARFGGGGEGSLAVWLAEQRDPVLVDDLHEDPRFRAGLLPYRSLVAVPLRMGEEPAGVLVALDHASRAFTRNDFQRAGILSKQLGLGVGKTLLYEQVEELSITDGLTGLYRHRYFQERLEGELERARRYGRPLSLVMADLDNFKAYNDRYGHLEGDELLRLAARTMREAFPPQAILARYGGEEFAVMTADATREQAAADTERFRAALAAARPGPGGAREPVTVSSGVAAFPADAQTRRDLIAKADAALYRAKRDGKNRVAVHETGAAS